MIEVNDNAYIFALVRYWIITCLVGAAKRELHLETLGVTVTTRRPSRQPSDNCKPAWLI